MPKEIIKLRSENTNPSGPKRDMKKEKKMRTSMTAGDICRRAFPEVSAVKSGRGKRETRIAMREGVREELYLTRIDPAEAC